MATSTAPRTLVEDPDEDSIRKRLLKHIDLLFDLSSKLKNTRVCFLTVVSCNGDCACSFTKAWCKTERNKMGYIDFKDLFDVEMIERVLNTGVFPFDTKDVRYQNSLKAFQLLASFIDTEEESSKIFANLKEKCIKESDWAVLFGNHILKKLAIAKELKLTDCGFYGAGMCWCGCKQKNLYTDTSMGNTQVWHGSVDMLLGNVAVAVAPENLEPIDQQGEGVTAFEVKLETIDKFRHQVVAEAITAGCCRDYLPLIALSKKNFRVFLYNWKHDLLFESEEFEGKNMENIVALWLIVNHSLFRLPINCPDRGVDFCSKFKSFTHAKKVDVIYERDMNLTGCRRGENEDVTSTREFFAENRGIKRVKMM